MKSYRRGTPEGVSSVLGVLVAFCCSAAPLAADVLYLKNGDKLTGSVIDIDEGDIHFDSDLADEVEVSLGDVESIETTTPLEIELEDGTIAVGYVVRDEDGTMYLRDGERGEEMDGKPGVTDADRAAGPFDLAQVHHVEEAKTYFNYSAHLDFGLTAATGNSDQNTMNAGFGFAPNFGKNHLSIQGQLNRAENDGDTTASNWRVQNRYERDLTRKLFAAALLDFENDKLADLNLRTSFAPGLGYRFFDGSPTDLKVFLGPAYIHANYKGSDDDADFLAALWRLDLEQDLWTSDLQLYHNHRLTVGITETGVLLLTTTGLKVDLIADLDLLLEFQYDWNSEPADDAKQSDQRYLVKLRYSFDGDQNEWF